ncbi:MAG TPA: hypothetical protein VK179_20405 [Bacteroidales bacterium]|nr:hypothetical protein [Bacteroidales bacterium]
MKRILKVITLGLALALISPTVMQAQLFDKGDMVISAGIGLGNSIFPLGSLYSTTLPPIWIAGDYCLREDLGPGNLGVGGILGYSTVKWGNSAGYKYTGFIIALRGTYHFTDLVDKLDLYGGIDIGGKIINEKVYGGYDPGVYSYSVLGSGVLVEPFAGARYYFTDNVAANAELGYGIAILKLGIAFKF